MKNQINRTDKNNFEFRRFYELEKGDVFKWGQLETGFGDKFMTVYYKDSNITKFNNTFGSDAKKQDMTTNLDVEVRIYPNRRKL